MAVAEAKVDIPTFPADKIESELRQRLAEEAKAQAQLRGTGSGGATSRSRASKAEPEIDSLVAVEALIVIESFVPFALSESIIRPGGYTSVDDFINDLVPKVNRRWLGYYKGKAS